MAPCVVSPPSIALGPDMLCLYRVPGLFYLQTECCCRCCCCSVCCFTTVAAAAAAAAGGGCCCWLLLLVAAAIRHCVPDGKTCCWLIKTDGRVLFLFIQTRVIFYVPLGSFIEFTASICLHPRNYGHARSQIGRQSIASKPSL